MRKGPAVTDEPAGGSAPGPDSAATTRIAATGGRRFPARRAADDSPDAAEPADRRSRRPLRQRHRRRCRSSGRPPADYGGDPTREPLAFDAPREPPIEAATSDEDVHLIPGATIAGGRYRLLVFHGGPPNLQFWQALDTALDRQVALTFVDPDATLPDDERAGNPVAHPQAEPHRHARRRPGARRRQHRLRRSGGLGVDPRRLAGRGRRHRRRPRSAVPAPSSRWPPPPRPPTAPVSHCRSTTPAGCGSASRATSRWPSPRPCPTPPRRTTSAASARRCTRC